MKKFLFSLLTLAAALTVASCQKELPVGNPDPLQGGPAVAATVSVNVNGVATKAFAAAENAKNLHIAFYSGGELVASISKVGEEAIDLTSTSYDYNVKLSRGAAYDIICWAEAEDSPYALDFEAKTVTYKDNVSLTANNDAYDAFYGVASLTADQTKNTVDLTIELKRPFAQVNVLVPDENAAAYTSFSSTMTVTVPTTMSLADGSLSGDPVAVEFANAAIDETTIKEGHTYVAMNYVFAPAEAANYAVSFTVTPNVAADAKEIDLDAVSLKRNRRTNLVGSIFDTEVDGNITVVIIPTTDDPEEQDINAVDADLAISLDPEATLDVSVGQPASFTITTNSTGTASVASADTDIATAEVATDGSAQATNTHTVTVTGVANGTTTVTVDITAGQTKASLKPAQVVVTVNVTGETPVEKTLESIAISDYTTEYTVGDTFTFDGTVTATYSDGTSASVEGATVSVAPDMTAAAENVPFTVSYTEGDITKTAEGSINVAAAPISLDNPVTFNFAAIHADAEGNLELSTETIAPITLTFDKNEAGGGATVPAFNKGSGEVRLYSNNKLTLSSEKYIIKVEFTFADDYAATSAAFAEDAFNPSEAIWTGSTKSLVITNPSANQIRFTEMKVTWSDEPATWPVMDPSLTFAEPSVSVEVDAKNTQVATSATGYKGEITYSSSNTDVATVNATTGQVTGVSQGDATITATSEANDRYTAGMASYSVTVTEAAGGPKQETIDGTFTFSDGTLSLTTDSGITITQRKGTGSTDVNSTYNTATTLRIYKGHTLTISAPSGKTITNIAFTNTNQYKGCTGISSNVGTFKSQVNCTWTGSASTIVITNDGTDNVQFRPTQIVVTYE